MVYNPGNTLLTMPAAYLASCTPLQYAMQNVSR